jgi:hypothetical protein
MAVRELEANTRDEGGKSWRDDENGWPEGGMERDTLIEVSCPEMEAAYRELDQIFLPKHKEPLWEGGGVKIYQGQSQFLYHRGMRVYELSKKSTHTYDVNYLRLTEDRTSAEAFLHEHRVKTALLACPVRDVVDRVLAAGASSWESQLSWDDADVHEASVTWREALPARPRDSLPPRFQAMAKTLSTGVAGDVVVSLRLCVQEWEHALEALRAGGMAQQIVLEKLTEQLTKAGWKDRGRHAKRDASA